MSSHCMEKCGRRGKGYKVEKQYFAKYISEKYMKKIFDGSTHCPLYIRIFYIKKMTKAISLHFIY